MNKLEKHYAKYVSTHYYPKAKHLANDTRKIAIEFSEYRDNYFYIDDSTEGDLYALDYTGRYPVYTIEELFDKFIEEKYEEINLP